MKEEMESLKKIESCILEELPQDKNIVDCKWIFKNLKFKVNGTIQIYKERLVANEYCQVHRIYY